MVRSIQRREPTHNGRLLQFQVSHSVLLQALFAAHSLAVSIHVSLSGFENQDKSVPQHPLSLPGRLPSYFRTIF